MIQFKYGSLEKFESLEQKDPNVLYFLDNHTLYKGNELISTVRTISGNFPEIPTADMKETYHISLLTGEIRYVTNELNYINISSLQLDNIVIDQNFVNKLVTAIGTKDVTMPTLTVNGDTMIWAKASEETIKILNL